MNKLFQTFRISILIVGFLFFARTSSAQGIPFIDQTIQKLRMLDNSGEVPLALKQYYKWYTRDMIDCESKDYYPEFTQKITELSLLNGITYEVTVNASKDSAVVKYQTIFERSNNITAKEFPTLTNNCTNKIPPGYYYVWCERSGKATSDKNKLVYIYDNIKVQLAEN